MANRAPLAMITTFPPSAVMRGTSINAIYDSGPTQNGAAIKMSAASGVGSLLVTTLYPYFNDTLSLSMQQAPTDVGPWSACPSPATELLAGGAVSARLVPFRHTMQWVRAHVAGIIDIDALAVIVFEGELSAAAVP